MERGGEDGEERLEGKRMTRTQTQRTHIHVHIPSRRTYHIGFGTTPTPSTTAPSFWLGDTHTHDATLDSKASL
jgi:hypothetical protein